MKAPRASVLLLGFVAGACGESATAPPTEPLPPVAEFQVVRSDLATGALPPTVAGMDGGTLRVTGYFQASCKGEQVSGSVTLPGPSSIRIQVSAREKNGACPPVTDAFTYEARIHNLGAGTYQVVVQHERDARRPDGPVLSTTLTVP